jgi:hypothetical protein
MQYIVKPENKLNEPSCMKAGKIAETAAVTAVVDTTQLFQQSNMHDAASQRLSAVYTAGSSAASQPLNVLLTA